MGRIQDAGDELFRLFQSMLPPANDPPMKKTVRQLEAQVSVALSRFYAEAKALRAKHRLGILARARVVRHLQNRMMSAGYEADLVYRVVFSLMLSAFVGRGK